MKIDAHLVKHVAQLANLPLTDQEIKVYTQQLSHILGYVDTLNQVNTAKVKPTYQIIDQVSNITRKDQVTDSSLTQAEALSQAEKTYQGYFVAPDVFGKKAAPTAHKLKRPQLDQYNAVLTLVNPQGKLGLKDLFCTQGVETTAASNVLFGYKPQYSATLVARLEKLGYLTKSKLNQDAWGHGSSGENSDFGPTLNPWDLTRVPGGSSSGSAVSVVVGDVEIAAGTDTCGSIRMPSNYCNVCGIKPTYGALSRYGVIAFASSLDCPGFLAGSVSKLRQVFNLVALPDPQDATSQSPLRNSSSSAKIKTIGLPRQFYASGLDPEIKNLVQAAADLLGKNGYKLKTVSLPHADYGIAAYYLIAPTEAASNLARYDGIRYGHNRANFGPEAKRRIMLGAFASSAGYSAKYYAKAAQIRTLIINDFQAVFKQVDAILAPVAPMPAFKIGAKSNNPLAMYLSDIYAAPASLAGLPSLAFPCGFTQAKLPVGIQLIGPRWTESALFALGEQYQKLTNWHLQKPKL